MAPLKLEDFTSAQAEPEVSPTRNDREEEIRLGAYEEGYGAGWEDAVTAQSDARAEREAEATRNLQMLAFGYQEVRHHILRSLEPFLNDVAAQLLPRVARASLAPVIAETLMPLAERLADTPVLLRVAPDVHDLVERLLPPISQGIPMILRVDPQLDEGQVMIATAKAEARVDLDAASAAIARAISDFFELQITEQAHAG
ncbi:FliH/SctL family protein [Paragemmobacter ruber]|uniref:Flagellar biosynthesis protein n=1 Tax=Paragemmobacter ruber TaxID=1985673 RepID=A0ABW9Y484_9RHOB|nr:flagellar biosynthesis protein [Rhodobacter ruber]NBE07367.1 flagellar biosynthesis protein [Rhodobacter ruber]